MMTSKRQPSPRNWLFVPFVLILAALACTLPGAESTSGGSSFAAFQGCANELVSSEDFRATFGGDNASTDDLAVIAFNQCVSNFSLSELQAIAEDPECADSSRCSSFFNDYLGVSEPPPGPTEAELEAEATETLAALPPPTEDTSQSEAPPTEAAPPTETAPTGSLLPTSPPRTAEECETLALSPEACAHVGVHNYVFNFEVISGGADCEPLEDDSGEEAALIIGITFEGNLSFDEAANPGFPFILDWVSGNTFRYSEPEGTLTTTLFLDRIEQELAVDNCVARQTFALID